MSFSIGRRLWPKNDDLPKIVPNANIPLPQPMEPTILEEEDATGVDSDSHDGQSEEFDTEGTHYDLLPDDIPHQLSTLPQPVSDDNNTPNHYELAEFEQQASPLIQDPNDDQFMIYDLGDQPSTSGHTRVQICMNCGGYYKIPSSR